MTTIRRRTTAGAITWARVEEGFYVGSRAGEFLGYIEKELDGTHSAYDMHAHAAGNFADRISAMNVLAAQPLPNATPLV